MNDTIKPRYTAEVTVTGGREGHAVSSNGVLDVTLRRPKTNGENEGTNPEQLFAAAWGGCFLGALGGAGRETGTDVSNAKVKVDVGIGEDTVNGGSGLMATISVMIPGLNRGMAQSVADQAHSICPYSKATRGNIPVQVIAVESID